MQSDYSELQARGEEMSLSAVTLYKYQRRSSLLSTNIVREWSADALADLLEKFVLPSVDGLVVDRLTELCAIVEVDHIKL